MVSSILLDHLLLRASDIIARFERKTSLTRYCAPSALARDVTIPINRILSDLRCQASATETACLRDQRRRGAMMPMMLMCHTLQFFRGHLIQGT
jgi:hypothetical protein